MGAVSWIKANGQNSPKPGTSPSEPAAVKKKIDPLNPPKDMTPSQVVKWLRLGRQVFAKNQVMERANAEALAQAQATAEEKVNKIAAARKKITMPKVTPAQIPKFLWMPEFNRSFRAFHFPLAVLLQTFAQILSSVGLLAADHPARTYEGAKSSGFFELFNEARHSLPSITKLWGPESIVSTRQYGVFACSIGVIITTGITLLTLFTQLFFGMTKAFAQAPYNSNISLNFTDNGKLGLGFINAIFSPNGTDVISASLGNLFRMYSTTMLVFAGVIVLWIIISAVAETARSGIPFGKQFNHVWAPLRLVVALGLLVPLGSGLNSGQEMIIGLAKWGSSQADSMWVEYAKSSDASTTTSGGGSGGKAVNSVLETVPVAQDNYRAVSDNLFDILLCQSLWNNYVAQNPGSGNPITRQETDVQSSDQAVKNIALLNADGTAKSVSSSDSYVKRVFWYDPTSKTDCGSIVFPMTSTSATSKDQAAKDARQSIFDNQSKELDQFTNLAGPLANQLAVEALKVPASGTGQIDDNNMGGAESFWDSYDQIADAYAAGRSNSISQSLRLYNQNMGKDITTDAQKYGWVSAPAWLNKIAEQNGIVMDAATSIPTVMGPNDAKIQTGNLGPRNNPAISGPWNVAYQYMSNARSISKKPVRSDASASQASLAKASFAEVLKPSANPLGKISSYGRKFMADGLKMTFASAETPDVKKDASGKIIRDVNGNPILTDGEGNVLENGTLTYNQALAKLATDNKAAVSVMKSMGSFTPGDDPALVTGLLGSALGAGGDQIPASMLRPVGTMMVSFGFMSGYVLPLLAYFRFMLGILSWILLLMEALLAVPLLAISLLKTDGEGFMTQNFQTGTIMILALVLRPILMIFGLLFGIVAFNGIMNITNVTFLSAADPDNSLQSVVIYLIIYGMLAYTLANSAFKAIDILPNQVMSWLGARLDQRVDDASVIHQQSSQMVGNLGMVTAMGGGSMKMGKGVDTKTTSGGTNKSG